MTQSGVLAHEFVEAIPDQLLEGILYVSIPYTTAVHKCCCGCGNEVVTPITPTDWKLIFDGETVSLDPSIGNWSFPCQSHYFIRRDRIRWAGRWSQDEINAGRNHDRFAKEKYFGVDDSEVETIAAQGLTIAEEQNRVSDAQRGFWWKLRKWWSQCWGRPR